MRTQLRTSLWVIGRWVPNGGSAVPVTVEWVYIGIPFVTECKFLQVELTCSNCTKATFENTDTDTILMVITMGAEKIENRFEFENECMRKVLEYYRTATAKIKQSTNEVLMVWKWTALRALNPHVVFNILWQRRIWMSKCILIT